MYCNKCGKKVPEESNFCLFCGANLAEYKSYFNEKNLESESSNLDLDSKIESKIDKKINEKNIDENRKPYKYKKALISDSSNDKYKNSYKKDTMVFKREEFLGSYKNLVNKNNENIDIKPFSKYDNKENKISSEIKDKKVDIKKEEISDYSYDKNNIKGHSFFNIEDEKDIISKDNKSTDSIDISKNNSKPKSKEKSLGSFFSNFFSNNEEEFETKIKEDELVKPSNNQKVLESDYDTSLYLDKEYKYSPIKGNSIIIDEKEDKIEIKEKDENNSLENPIKRFVKYMFEEEEYDISYLTTRSKESDNVDLDNLEEPKIENAKDADEIIPDSNIDKSIDYEVFEDNKNDNLKKESNVVIDKKDISNKSDIIDKNNDKNIIDLKSKSDLDNQEYKEKSSSQKPENSVFKKFKEFMYESEDEDDLLDLSPNEYEKLKKEVVTNFDRDSIKTFFFGNSSKKEDDILEDRIFIENPSDENSNYEKELDYDEITTADEIDDPYLNADKNQNIRFSKKVIDTHQKKKSDKNELIETNNNNIPKDETIELEKEIENKNIQDIKEEEISESERYILKDELEKAFKDEIDSGKIVIEMEEKPNKALLPIKNFFGSIGEFFSSKEKSKNKKSENIEIIVNSPIDTEDTMPLKLTKEEREFLNKELNKRNKSKTSSSLNKMHENIKPLIKKLLSQGSSFIIPMLIIALVISIFSLTKGVKTIPSAVILGFLKVIVLYFSLYISTNTSFKSVGIRLKQNVITLFVVIGVTLIIAADLIYILLSSSANSSLDNLFKAFSPNIIVTIVSLILLGCFIMIANYKKLEERAKIIEFLGWFIVLSITVSLIMILLQFLITTLVYTAFPGVLY